MKLERLHESVIPTVVLIAGLGLALLAGSAVGQGRYGMIGLLLALIFSVGLVLMLRERIWLMIPATWMLGGKISVLPLPFSIAHIGILFAFGTFLMLKAFKVIRMKPKFGLLDFWMLLVLAYLGTVFLRNPVGVEALGSERVGGRPYFDVVVAYLGYWVLARSAASPRDAFYVPVLAIAGNAFHAAINSLAYRVPGLVAPLAQLYSGVAAAENPDSIADLSAPTSRSAHLAGLGGTVWLTACSVWRPLTVINPIYFGRFIVFLFSSYLILQSGFRSVLLAMIFTFQVSTYFRRGIKQVILSTLVGAIALGMVLLMQGTIIQLPYAAQRALSFLPGKWDYMAKKEAESSTEWRMDMWKAVLTGNKYIADKWLGDGFGFTRVQLQIMLANSQTGTTADQQENLMISGGVHSGPITAIRYVGFVGLALFLILLAIAIRDVNRLLRRSKNTPFFNLSLFICIPIVIFPGLFLFIFGAYETDLPNMIIAIGMLKMLENSLDAHATKTTEPPAQNRPEALARRLPRMPTTIEVR